MLLCNERNVGERATLGREVLILGRGVLIRVRNVGERATLGREVLILGREVLIFGRVGAAGW